MKRLSELIIKACKEFELSLASKVVLTEAATGNYACTPLIAACAEAKVYALAKNSTYGSVEQIKSEIALYARELNVERSITIVSSLSEIDLSRVNILTNTGFLRPLDRTTISRLNQDCVIPLMWEPWEFRPRDLDLEACAERGIKVYGTNESDHRLRTMDYLGHIVLFFLLNEKYSYFSADILVIGCDKFLKPIKCILEKLNYKGSYINTKSLIKGTKLDYSDYNVIIIAEHSNPGLIVGNGTSALINKNQLCENHILIHIAGNVDFEGVPCRHYPKVPAKFGHMSYTTDFIDPYAVVSLHSAGLKVAEGMLRANEMRMSKTEYKKFMEANYPALAFEEPEYW